MHKAATIFVVFVVLGLVSCATAPAPRPLGPESAAIGISVKIYQVGPDLSAQQVYLIKLNEGEGLYTQGNFIRSNYVKGGQAYFLNLKPGRYAAVGSHTTFYAPWIKRTYEYKAFFPKELIKLTEVTVAPGTLAFMGKYVVKQSLSFEDADEAQLHYLHLIAPGALTGWSRIFTTKQSYRGLLLEEHRDKQDEIEFLTNAQKHFKDSAWINIVQKRMEELKAEKNQKIEPDKLVVTGLQAEPTKQQVEVEKPQKGPSQTKPKVSEKQLIEKEKQKLAYVPKTTSAARISLRKEPKKLLEKDIRKMLSRYDFYDDDLNWQGSFANAFVDNGNGTITDKATGLMWQKSGSSRTKLWKRARTYVKRLNKGSTGYSDWRLPTIDELASLVEREKVNGVHTDPLFDKKQKSCWSSDKGPPFGTLTQVWHVNFREGSLGLTVLPLYHTTPTTRRYVRAVRSSNEEKKKSRLEQQKRHEEELKLASIPEGTAKVSLRKEPKKFLERDIRRMVLTYDFYDDDLNWRGSFTNDFVDNGDGTITDRATGLMWQKSGSSRAKTWKRARTYVKRLNKGSTGYSDWRLPTIEELASLVEREKANGVHIDPIFFNTQKSCWSADKGPLFGGYTRNSPQVWHVNFHEGSLGLTVLPTYRTAVPTRRYVRAVRSLR
jgi:hypothetical protein